jgi:molybdopterin-synthase adenylyltransferase
VRIHGWRQDLVAQQTVLLLGVGGLGSAVAINLLRLGVKKLFLVDYDIVDHHNLNRQLLYGPADVGRRKIECALEKCKEHNVGGT